MNPSSVQTKNPSVCLVHDWLIAMRGGEKVLEALAELFPGAPIYTLFARRENLSRKLQEHKIHTTFLQFIPGICRFYRWLLPLFPLAIRSVNVKKYDVVISSSHCVAKAVRAKSDAVHICYCYTPMRYLWGFSEEYFGKFTGFLRHLIGFYFNFLKKWDVKTAQDVTAFVTSSRYVAERIQSVYGKTAEIINPPIDVPAEKIVTTKSQQGLYFLIVSALVPYKRIDIAIEAFNQLKLPLNVVGDGPLRTELQKMIRFDQIRLEGWIDQETLWERYSKCKAFIFPTEEDFGIVPIEAQMFGKPVIAYGKGGISESVLAYNETGMGRALNQSTGLFFYEQSVPALIEQIKEFEHIAFDPKFIKAHAERFKLERFQKEITNFMKQFSIPTSFTF